MKLLTTKNTRFSEVVASSGKPNVYTLWKEPESDRQFQSLIKTQRVMTVLQSDSGTDFGQVGFKFRKGARYLVFPKTLKNFLNHRIIGIKWDETAE